MVRRSIRYRCLYYQRGIDRICFRTREAAKNQSEQPQSSDLNQAKQLEIQTVQETENDSQSYWGTVAHNFVKGEGGYYYMDNGDSYLMFFDEETQESYPLCALPNCQHNTTDCNAYVGTQKGTG